MKLFYFKFTYGIHNYVGMLNLYDYYLYYYFINFDTTVIEDDIKFAYKLDSIKSQLVEEELEIKHLKIFRK